MNKTLCKALALLGLMAFYALLPPGANAQSISDLERLRSGDMARVQLSAIPTVLAAETFEDLSGEAVSLLEYRGKVVLLNFWAIWCAPCRIEMPHLEALNKSLGGQDFAVVTLATGRNNPAAITRFFDQIGAETLPSYVDPQSKVAGAAEVRGLPVTLLLDRQGRVLARLEGIADWNAADARRLITAVIAQ